MLQLMLIPISAASLWMIRIRVRELSQDPSVRLVLGEDHAGAMRADFRFQCPAVAQQAGEVNAQALRSETGVWLVFLIDLHLAALAHCEVATV